MPNLTILPKYYTWKDVLALYSGDEDTFLDDYADGTLPLEIRRAIEDTMVPATLQCWLLRRIIRQQAELLNLLAKP